MTTYGSLFSGAGGFDLGSDAAGWQCKFQVEWDPKARSVLQRHWPNVPKWSDVRDVNGAEIPPVDVITFGFPCQDLSMAGTRTGLDGKKSGLFFEAMRIIREMREKTNGKFPTIVCVENVTGLLNADAGVAMGRCLDELAHIGAVGIEWRVYDAQFFGVPQRRRRVFIVASFDPRTNGRGPVFPLPDCVLRDNPAGSVARQTTPNGIGDSIGSGGIPTIANTIGDPNGTECDDDIEQMTFIPRLSGTISTGGPQNNFEFHIAIPVSDVIGTMTTKPHGYGRAEVDGNLYLPTQVGTLTTRAQGYGTQYAMEGFYLPLPIGVRRFTPRETERLQGWPDDHTRWDADGKELGDGHRYKMTGNGVATPVAKYVCQCIERVLQ